MPAEPQPPSPPAVEAMLRDAARLRRDAFDAAGPAAATMPGPTRARLHAELAKRFADDAAAAASPSPGWFARWWPALAGIAGTATAVALLVVVGQRPPGKESVAVANAPAVSSAPIQPPPAPPAPPEPVAGAAAAKPVAPSIADATPAPAAEVDAAALARSRASTAETVRTLTFTQAPLPLAAAFSRRAAPAPAAAPAAAPAPAGSLRRPGADASARAAAPAAPSSSAAAAPPALLENFRFEQRGENVRLVDADGSVYVGQVQPERSKQQTAASPGEANVAKDKLESAEIAQKAEQNFRFRAAGDNRTLRKPVVFEGEYSVQPSPDAAPAALQKKAAPPSPAPTPEAQIRGRIRVLDGREDVRGAEVDARAVGPR